MLDKIIYQKLANQHNELSESMIKISDLAASGAYSENEIALVNATLKNLNLMQLVIAEAQEVRDIDYSKQIIGLSKELNDEAKKIIK